MGNKSGPQWGCSKHGVFEQPPCPGCAKENVLTPKSVNHNFVELNGVEIEPIEMIPMASKTCDKEIEEEISRLFKQWELDNYMALFHVAIEDLRERVVKFLLLKLDKK